MGMGDRIIKYTVYSSICSKKQIKMTKREGVRGKEGSVWLCVVSHLQPQPLRGRSKRIVSPRPTWLTEWGCLNRAEQNQMG